MTGDVLVKYSCTLSLLALWERPWSSNALRFAYHALTRALAHGCDVLEAARSEDASAVLYGTAINDASAVLYGSERYTSD